MKTSTLRVVLFSIWCVLFVIYIGLFLAVARWREVIDISEARDAARQIAYIFLPALAAFAGFWFTPDDERKLENPESANEEVVSFERTFAAFALTGMVHTVVLGYFLLFVVFGEFNYSPDPDESFAGVVAWGLNLLVALSSLALLPVGFLTKQKVKPYVAGDHEGGD
jgi:hypothetical protein